MEVFTACHEHVHAITYATIDTKSLKISIHVPLLLGECGIIVPTGWYTIAYRFTASDAIHFTHCPENPLIRRIYR